jgi:hypothetical protein
MFFHPYLKGDLPDTTPEYVLVFGDIGQDERSEISAGSPPSSRDDLMARLAA